MQTENLNLKSDFESLLAEDVYHFTLNVYKESVQKLSNSSKKSLRRNFPQASTKRNLFRQDNHQQVVLEHQRQTILWAPNKKDHKESHLKKGKRKSYLRRSELYSLTSINISCSSKSDSLRSIRELLAESSSESRHQNVTIELEGGEMRTFL